MADILTDFLGRIMSGKGYCHNGMALVVSWTTLGSYLWAWENILQVSAGCGTPPPLYFRPQVVQSHRPWLLARCRLIRGM